MFTFSESIRIINILGFETRFQMGERGGIRFNPVALFGAIVFVIGLILALVSIGMETWSTLTTSRENVDSFDSKTYKSQGPIRRCVSYLVSRDISLLPAEQQPQNRCIYMNELECDRPQMILPSAHVVFNISELNNVNNEDDCNEMKLQLYSVFSFTLLGILGTFVAAILSLPILPLYMYVASALVGIASAICFAISIGTYTNIDQTFSGFFSLSGNPEDGCLSHGFGLATGAMCLDLLASSLQFFAIFYHQRCNRPVKDD